MKAISNYDSIKVGGGSMFPAGAYVCRIFAVEDHSTADGGYLDVYPEVYDTAARKFTNSDELRSESTRWRYRFRLSLDGEWGPQRYKRLVSAVERTEENKGFKYQNVDGGEQQLVGKWVGLVARHRRYTKRDGSDGITLDAAAWIPCADVLSCNYKPEWLETRDTRTNAGAPAAPMAPAAPTAPVPDIADEDLPF